MRGEERSGWAVGLAEEEELGVGGEDLEGLRIVDGEDLDGDLDDLDEDELDEALEDDEDEEDDDLEEDDEDEDDDLIDLDDEYDAIGEEGEELRGPGRYDD
jgi:hypothetical protein